MNFFDGVKWFFAPYTCLFCGDIQERGVIFCEECKKDIILRPRFCKTPNIEDNLFCCLGAFHYAEPKVRQGILNLKFNNSKELAAVFADFLSQIDNSILSKIDYVTCVPLSKGRKRWRGYNQSELIAKSYANFVGKEYADLLIKIKSNKTQSTLESHSQRMKNVKKLYKPSNPELIKGKHILIIDDVYTSGATMQECARVLRKNGAARVIGLVVANAN